MRSSSALVVALLFVGVACSSPHDETGPSGRPSPAARREVLGRAIAVGMSSSTVRAELLEAMRTSPLVDHKIALDEWVSSMAGSRFLRAIADLSAMDQDSLRALVQELAPVDLYFPKRSDRASWRGAIAPMVLVEPGIHQRALRLYDSEGIASEAVRNGPPVPAPLLMLQASEGRDRRIGPLVLSAASIQDPKESGLGGAITLRRRDGSLVEVQLADVATNGSFMQQCPPDLEDSCGGGGGGGGSIVGGGGVTYLNGLSVNNVNDNGVPGESNEFEFRAKAYIGLDVIGEATLRLTGVDPNYANTNMHLPLMANAPDNFAYIEVDVVETDGWPNPDDNFDYVTYQPNQVFFKIPLYLADQGRWWPLKEQPYIGVFDPEKVLPQFTWVNN